MASRVNVLLVVVMALGLMYACNMQAHHGTCHTLDTIPPDELAVIEKEAFASLELIHDGSTTRAWTALHPRMQEQLTPEQLAVQLDFGKSRIRNLAKAFVHDLQVLRIAGNISGPALCGVADQDDPRHRLVWNSPDFVDTELGC